MIRPYNERRNRKVIVLVERRKMPQKEVAHKLNLTHANVRWILFCYRKLTKPNSQKIAP
jgi:DNA-directed RNA polymerase specialized sigma24 family protein